MLRNPHPNLYILIDFLKQQQCSAQIDYLRIHQRIFSKQRPPKETKNLMIELCKVEYNSTLNFKEFFRGLNYYIQYPADNIIQLDLNDESRDLEDEFIVSEQIESSEQSEQIESSEQSEQSEQSEPIDVHDNTVLPDLTLDEPIENINQNNVPVNIELNSFNCEASNVEANTESNISPHQTYAQLETITSPLQPTTSYSSSSITITSRGRLADLAREIEEEEETDDGRFDIVKNGINYEQLNQVFDRNRVQQEFIDGAVNRRAIFTTEQLRKEVKNYWQANQLKRKKVTKKDLEDAHTRLKKKIRID